jgi:hypothetical protein
MYLAAGYPTKLGTKIMLPREFFAHTHIPKAVARQKKLAWYLMGGVHLFCVYFVHLPKKSFRISIILLNIHWILNTWGEMKKKPMPTHKKNHTSFFEHLNPLKHSQRPKNSNGKIITKPS